MAPLLETRDLKKYFPTSRGQLHAVDGISLSLEKGQTLGVVGESGCGKSTFGRVLLHLLESTSGKIFFEGNDITKVDRKGLTALRKQMQMIFQDPFSSLNPRMTISQTIAEPLIIAKELSKHDINNRVSELMDLVGIAPRLRNSYPHELDGGRRQRVGIARALALNPKFVVCDEPVSALDVSIQAQVLNLLIDLREKMGLTYVFITHDLSVVRYISDKIMVMYLGEVVELAPKNELFATRFHPYTKALLGAVLEAKLHVERKEEPLKGELTSPVNPKPGCRFAARCKYAKERCKSETPELREMQKEHYVKCHFCEEINSMESKFAKK
jgi:oligopeptide/dipeptide ABC transporter ATP-binding protein